MQQTYRITSAVAAWFVVYLFSFIAFSTDSAAWAAAAQSPAASRQGADAKSLNMLLFELRLDNDQLADGLTAYEIHNDILFPLGELTRLLTIGVNVDYRTKVASGFVLTEDRIFRVDMASQTVTLPGGTQPFDSSQVRWIDDDIYVSSKLLQSWLPIDLQINLNTLSTNVIPREKLPIQAKLERERLAKGLGRRGGQYKDPRYPRAGADYDLISMPFIDQTLGVDVSRNNGDKNWNAAYSAFITADLLGTEASVYLTSNKTKPDPDARIILARHDPDAGLLGPLHARSAMAGNITVPALTNVLRGGANGNGVIVSNRPLNQSSSYGLQTLRGDLPAGWDVTLYFNDALIGFQQSRPDGFYVFEDQPLVYGTNEFRLVFNGPLGQTRVERQIYILDQTMTKPGEFFYTFATQHMDTGGERQTMQFDLGLTKNLAVTGGLVRLPSTLDGQAQSFSNIGLRASTLGMLLSADYVKNDIGGSLYELGLKTQIRRFSLDFTHTALQDGYVSDFFQQSADPIDVRDRGRITGSIAVTEKFRLPVALDVKREQTQSGIKTYDATGRISANLLGTNLTNSLNWRSIAGVGSADGTLQISRRLAGVGVSSQIAYSLEPDNKIASYALSVDKNFGESMRASFGMLHAMDPSVTTYTAGLNRNFGSFGLGVSARHSTLGESAIGMQLFMAMGRDPRSGKWMLDWQPMAPSGALSTQAYIDANMNGKFDQGEKPIEGVGYIINGGYRHPKLSNADGLAYLSRLSPKQYTDIAIDPGTLEDPQWVPETPGVRVLPRPGKAQVIDFPVVMTGEVDGTVYLKNEDGKLRGIGNAQIELLDNNGDIAVTATSASDGYYILTAVRPGKYMARISPEQLDKLDLMSSESKPVVITADGKFIDGLNFTVFRK